MKLLTSLRALLHIKHSWIFERYIVPRGTFQRHYGVLRTCRLGSCGKQQAAMGSTDHFDLKVRWQSHPTLNIKRTTAGALEYS